MILTKSHRKALLSQLKEAERELDLRQTVTDSFEQKENQKMVEYSQIDEYLLTEKIELIKEALLNNEIEW